jgi:predicted nucleic-acid-binding protein
MTQRFGIDTSILVRLASGQPQAAFDATVRQLVQMVERQGNSLVAVNMVIGEAYIALQHHYKVSKRDAKAALHSVLISGLVQPVGGAPVLQALTAARGCGLMDRLIALDCASAGATPLTLDRKMATLPGVMKLGVQTS